MAIKDAILPEFDHEMASTRTLLERVPDGDPDWKPHPKSMALGQLAGHVATIPGWGAATFAGTELDLNPPGGTPYVSPRFQSTADLVKAFDQNVKQARAAIDEASDADMGVLWTLKNAGATVLTMPRTAILRTFVMNHLIHHRAQLGVYLRLRNIALPSMYGPTGDM